MALPETSSWTRQTPFLRPLALVALAFGCLCALWPFTRTIDYPLALVATPCFTLLFAIAGALAEPLAPGPAVRQAGLLLAVALAALLFPPALAGGATGTICEPLYGLLLILIGPAAGGFWGHLWGAGLRRLLATRTRALAALFAGLAVSLAVVAAEFFCTPTIRFYNSFFGLYHGAIYDEAVFVQLPYLWLRLWQATALLLLWLLPGTGHGTAVGRPRSGGPKAEMEPSTCEGRPATGLRGALQRYAGALAAALALVTLTLLAPRLGFLATTGQINRVLSAELVAGPLRIRTVPGGQASRSADRIALDLNQRYDRIVRLFDLPPDGLPVTVYVYESPAHKAALMGAGRTSIAKPWLRQIHIHGHESGGRLPAHELAHVLLGPLARSTLAIPTGRAGLPRPGILEGAAVAAEPPGGPLSTHQWAAAMRAVDRLPKMESVLESLAFWGASASSAYTACGSFVLYLLQEHGSKPFAALYGGDDFAAAYGRELPSLLDDWYRFLDSVPLTTGDRELADYLFSVRPVFDRQCPYASGRCLERARRAIRRGDSRAASAQAAQALQLSGCDDRVGQAAARLLLAAEAPVQALALLQLVELGDRELGRPALDSLTLLRADALLVAGQAEEASLLYRPLAGTAWDRWTAPLATLRLLAAGLEQDQVRTALGAFAGSEREERLQELWKASGGMDGGRKILVGLLLAPRPEWQDEALELLAAANSHEVEPTVAREAGLARVELLFYSGQAEAAAEGAAQLTRTGQEPMLPAQQNRLADLQERIAWLAARQ